MGVSCASLTHFALSCKFASQESLSKQFHFHPLLLSICLSLHLCLHQLCSLTSQTAASYCSVIPKLSLIQ